MSKFDELLSKINEISNAFVRNINDDLQAAFNNLHKFEEEYVNGRRKAREKTQKTLQSIHEDDVEPTKLTETDNTNHKTIDNSTTDVTSNTGKPKRTSKKRSKHEVDDMSSPEPEKRIKRGASVRAQSIISKQVNVNLNQKMRREDTDKTSRGRRRKEDDKENAEPLPNIQIKQEKISLPPEPMDTESLPLDVEIKQEANKDEIAMPPPAKPLPRPRKAAAKEKASEEISDDEPGKKRSNRAKKQTADIVAAPAPSARSTRANSRASSRVGRPAEPEGPATPPPPAEPEGPAVRPTEPEAPATPPPPEPRPKRTRAKKKISEPPAPEPEKAVPKENGLASPTEPRPKRTRRGQKAAEKQEAKPQETVPPPLQVQEEKTSPKEERVSEPEVPSSSPILQKEKELIVKVTRSNLYEVDALDKTRVLRTASEIEQAPVTEPNANNKTVVIEPANRETMVLEKAQVKHMDATFVLDKEPKAVNLTDDNSLLTDDSDTPEPHTPPKKQPPPQQPSSAVKEKVQQFEELASRATRTKTRAMAKKAEQSEQNEHTPPDKIVKPVLSAETLTKMNNMIFNGKPPQISSSSTKARATPVPAKSGLPTCTSTSKLSGIARAREADELRREREDARSKKEAMLEAKREMQRRKREEKMAAAAAAREAAERDRRAAMEAAAKDRMEKQAHADQGRLERLKEAERKKQELARKVAETEERRRAEEHARQQRLAEEQRRADDARRKQLEEAAAMKKEAAMMAKEIEKRQKEYNEKLKMKHRMEDKSHTPLKNPHASIIPPVYMLDGFQYLNSDEDEDEPEKPVPVPSWSIYKHRTRQLSVQSRLSAMIVDRWFSVRVHSPDLRDIFPNIERVRLKRTSSAVWRTPPAPARLPVLSE